MTWVAKLVFIIRWGLVFYITNAIQYDVMSLEHSFYFLRTTVPSKRVINWIQMIDYSDQVKFDQNMSWKCFLFYNIYGIIYSVSIRNSVLKLKNRYNKVLTFNDYVISYTFVLNNLFNLIYTTLGAIKDRITWTGHIPATEKKHNYNV